MGAARHRLLTIASLLCLSAAGSCTRPRDPQPAPPPNIVLILIDTLRADHLGCYGYPRATSSNIDRLAATGTLFENTASVASYTRAATGSLFTGLYPSVHGSVAYGESLADGAVTLAQLLSGAGYETVGYYLNGNVAADFGFDRGFERYEHPGAEFRKLQQGNPNRLSWRATDEAITWKALPFLRGQHERPFFLYLHFIGPHAPYVPPPDAASFVREPLTPTARRFYEQPEPGPDGNRRELIGDMQFGIVPVDEQTKPQMVDLYDGEVAFTDREVGAILEALHEEGLSEDTVVILTSDHGEEFWEHGSVSHGHSHYQELLRIPLVIAGPGVRARRIETPVGLIDVMPTVLELAGLVPSPSLPGRSLLPTLRVTRKEPEARPLYAEGLLRFDGAGVPISFFRSIEDDGLKLILDGRKHEKLLFDLEQDPGEKRNLLEGPRRDEGRPLMDKLVEIHGKNLRSPHPGPSRSVEMDPALEENLRALGYVGGDSGAVSTSVFRAPLRVVDMERYGFLGSERNLSRYRSELDFSTDELSGTEQLLYGWQKRPSEQAILMNRRAGLRLKREADDREWHIRGYIPGRDKDKLESPVELEIRLDGLETHLEKIPSAGSFEASGSLPKTERPFLRLDLSCSGSPLAVRHGYLDELAPCVFLSSIAVE